MKTFKEIKEAVKMGHALSISMNDITISKSAMASAKKVQKLIQKGMGTEEAIDAILNPMVDGKKTSIHNTPGGASKHRREIQLALGHKWPFNK
jgi:CII-binding regulator of phage lambda lysogenization HflD